MKKLLFILPDLKGGGAQKMIINLANALADKGHLVTLCLINDTGLYRNLISEKITVVNFNKARSFTALFHLIHLFTNHSFDAVTSCLYHLNSLVLLANILSGSRQRIIVTERNHFSKRIAAENSVHRLLFTALVKILYPYAYRIVGISNGVRDDLKNILGKKQQLTIHTLYNPVITSQHDALLAKDTIEIFPTISSGLKLITSGRLVEQKDYFTLLEALALYRDTYNTPFYMAILGQGILEEAVKQKIDALALSSHIGLLGFVDNPLSYMKQADIFILSSQWEGFGNVLVEALYCGLKIISTDCPSGPSEILNNGQYGYLTPVGDHRLLCETIHIASQQPIESISHKKRALEFTADKIADRFLDLIK